MIVIWACQSMDGSDAAATLVRHARPDGSMGESEI